MRTPVDGYDYTASFRLSARQGCLLSPVLFNFANSVLLEVTMPTSVTSGVEMLSGGSPTDIEYVAAVDILDSHVWKMKTTLHRPNNSATRFEMRSTAVV
ncbi:hypothetical protein CLF_102118 [Clonorchis sinensis]|uniref:Reverse transcriptase domain-containing protein n=1 Tax=Clonorchis sinensis TaxID=79923 RepID=G7Y7B9_CLOSI|nr:hypothetical protein CLF_102118 [Clonorchis sinensis]